MRTVILLALCALPGLAANPKNKLPMGEFEPRSTLHVPEHKVDRAKFPVIDVHSHVNGRYGEKIEPAELVKVMDALNIRTIVTLTGGWGEDIRKFVEAAKPYPGRFVVFTQVDWSRIDEPNFGELMAKQIREAYNQGARGLKILKELGLEVKDKSGKLITVDDPRLDSIWAECGKLRIPVAIHVADPEAFFSPVDRFNERWEELGEHPDWSFCCPPKFPTMQEILDARDRMLARHPKTTFILLHVGHWPENLDHVGATLRRFPNTYVELGARAAELGRQPKRAREFFLRFADRIMFGTDFTVTADMYRNWFRWLETGDEYFDYWGFPGQGFWKIYGLELPDPVLKKVYHDNADKVLKIAGAYK